MPSIQLFRGEKASNFYNTLDDEHSLPSLQESTEQIVEMLVQKAQDLETALEGKVGKGEVKSEIALGSELIKIQADEVAVVGAFTVIDIINDQNGTATGTIPADITRIVGDKVRTGQITSNNWGASEGTFIDLDNSIIQMGGSSSPKFDYDGAGNLTISGELTAGSIIATSVTVGGTAIGDIKSNASAGYGLQQQLEVSGSTVLKGTISPEDAGGFKVGSITWNATSGALTGGSGIAITEYGIIGAASGTPTFTIVAATGESTWSGDISTSGSVLATGVTTSGSFTGTIVGTTTTAGRDGVVGSSTLRDGVRGSTEDGSGVHGTSSVSGDGVKGVATSLSGRGGYFSGAGVGLEVDGLTTNLNTTLNVDGYTTIDDSAEVTGSLTVTSRIDGSDDMVLDRSLYVGTDASSGDSSIVIGLNATGETGKNTLVFAEGTAGSQVANQFHFYGQLDSSQSKTTVGITSEATVESGTGAFTGINQFPMYINGSRWLFGCIAG